MKRQFLYSTDRRQGRLRQRVMSLLWVVAGVTIGLVSGCALVYPELSAPLNAVPGQRRLDPPPPDDLLYLYVADGRIPPRTQDGRRWDEVGSGAPDPFVVVLVDDVEILRTPVESNTRRPVWKQRPEANYRIPAGAAVRVEMWDQNTVQDQPICSEAFTDIHDDLLTGGRFVLCTSGARVHLVVERAKALWGLGFKYQVRKADGIITRVYQESPASRAELHEGQRISAVDGKPVAELGKGEFESRVNAHAQTGVGLQVVEGVGVSSTVTLRNGPIYPVDGDGLSLMAVQ